ncbi:MAG: hypothetical protein EOO38_25690, partial [Cytophagaceae bacterium]
MFNYEIGGNEIKPMASEGIADIPFNRTMLALQLTDEEPVTPELVTGLKTVEDVFNRYQPNVDVEFEDEEAADAVDGAPEDEEDEDEPMAEEEEAGPSGSVRASATPAPAPRQRTQIKYDDYIKIHNMLLHRVNEDQSAAEDGVDEEDLLVWFLEQKEAELQSQEDMEAQKSLARKVLKKMAKTMMPMVSKVACHASKPYVSSFSAMRPWMMPPTMKATDARNTCQPT